MEDFEDDNFSYEDDPLDETPVKYGFINRDGDYVIEPKFDWATDFNDGLAIVRVEGKCGLINLKGAYVINPTYHDIEPVGENIFRVVSNSKIGFIDSSGQVIVAPKYDSTRLVRFEEGAIEVIGADDRCGFIDTHGKEITPLIFEATNSFFLGVACVLFDGLFGFIDKSGKWVIPPSYEDCQRYMPEDGLLWVMNGGKYGYVDKTGRMVIPLNYDNAYGFKDGHAAVMTDGKWGLINLEGEMIVPPEYDDITEVWNDSNLFFVKKDDKWGVIDHNGREIVQPIYQKVIWNKEDRVFSVKYEEEEEEGKADDDCGFLPFDDESLWGILDENGETIVSPCYSFASGGLNMSELEFHEGLAGVMEGDKWGYINRQGEMVIKARFERVSNFEGGLAYVEVNERDRNLGALINKEGEFVVKPSLNNVSAHIENGYLRAAVGSYLPKWGVLDLKGNFVVPPIYEYVLKDCSEGMARIQEGEKFGFADCQSGKVIHPHFDYVWDFKDGIALVRIIDQI